MAEKGSISIEFSDGYCCPFCGTNDVSEDEVVLTSEGGPYTEILCGSCGETLAYQEVDIDED